MDEVVWTEPALRQLDQIGAYIAEDDPGAAHHIITRIRDGVAGLSYHPRIGRRGRVAGTRELVIFNSPYIVVYQISERVEILAIYHAARKWPDTF